MGGERASTTRMREAGKICCLCKTFLKPLPITERYCSKCDPTRHRVYMHFMNTQGGWYCQFLEKDLKTPLRRKLHFHDFQKVVDLAKRGGAEFTAAVRREIEEGMENGRGSVWLNLKHEQYAKLR